MDLINLALGLTIILASLTVHEAAHAWTADRLGDPTARMLGRVSLNPIVHIDPIGTLLLPAIAIASGFPILGWAKPVPVNTSRLREPRRDFMLVAAAGPGSNVLLAIVCAALYSALPGDGLAAALLNATVRINIFLAVFNMIPVPPLDGGNVLAGLLPREGAAVFESMRPYGVLILYALMFTGALSAIIMPPASFLIGLLLP